jgi:hypothetical protein
MRSTAIPKLTLAGDVMRDHYKVASLTLAFARGTALGRECCWALALGAATLAACMTTDASLCIQRSIANPADVHVSLYGTWVPDSQETVALTLSRLRDLGFHTPTAHDGTLLELQS